MIKTISLIGAQHAKGDTYLSQVKAASVPQAGRPYLWGAMLALIAFTAIPYGTAAPWWESFFECSVFALGILWLTVELRRGQSIASGNVLLWPWLAILAFAFAQTLPVWGDSGSAATMGSAAANVLSANPFGTRLFMLKLLALVVAGVVLRACVCGSESRLRSLVHLVIGIGTASAIFALVRMAAHRDGTFFVLPLLQAGTGYGQFINHNHFAFLMEMAWGLLCGLVLSGVVNRDWLPAYVAAGVLMWTALVLSESRGGIFSMLGQLCFLGALWPNLLLGRRWRNSARSYQNEDDNAPAPASRRQSPALRIGLVACLLAVAIVGVMWVGGDSLANRFGELPGEVRAAENLNPRLKVRRIEMWAATWQLIRANPVAGIGFGGFEPAVTEYYDASGNWTLQEAHNDYLELLASGGIIGALLVLCFVGLFIREARRQLHSSSSFRRAACRGALVGLCGVALHSLVDFGLHLTINALVCVALIVMATANLRDESSARVNAPG